MLSTIQCCTCTVCICVCMRFYGLLVKLYDAVVHSLSLFPCFLEWFQY